MSQVSVEHIAIDEKGVARLLGRRTKVSMIVQDMQSGMTGDDIHEAYPDLSLAEIYAAFAYYYDHRQQIEDELQRSREVVEEFARNHPDNGLLERLRAKMPRP